MNTMDYIIIAVIALAFTAAAVYVIRRMKKGKCCGCGDCSGCGKCPNKNRE